MADNSETVKLQMKDRICADNVFGGLLPVSIERLPPTSVRTLKNVVHRQVFIPYRSTALYCSEIANVYYLVSMYAI